MNGAAGGDPGRVGCTMCHGVYPEGIGPSRFPFNHVYLIPSTFERRLGALREAGIACLSYEQLAAWRRGQPLAQPSVLIDFDHPALGIWTRALPLMEQYGYTGNLFIYTGKLEAEAAEPPDPDRREHMTWDQIGRLVEKGWWLGAHTVSHYELHTLEEKDPSGGLLLEELAGCDETIQRRLGIAPRDFAYTGLGWSPLAERIVRQRYRFARLWLTGRKYKRPGGEEFSPSELLGCEGPDEADGGPPYAARYITRSTDPYRLPSMELEYLLTSDEAFMRYLAGVKVGDMSGPRTVDR